MGLAVFPTHSSGDFRFYSIYRDEFKLYSTAIANLVPLLLVRCAERHACVDDCPHLAGNTIVIGLYFSSSRHRSYLPLLKPIEK
jgi:hypothetical protein